MKRTKWLLCILTILATVLFAGCCLAEETPELSFEIPESVVFGMPIPISGISTSSVEGSIEVIIGEYSATTIYPEGGAWPESVTLSNDSMFRYYTKAAGRYDLSLLWLFLCRIRNVKSSGCLCLGLFRLDDNSVC